MPIDQRGPVIQGALLRSKLTRLRKDNSLTQDEVAAELEWHTSKLIRIEGGRTGISRQDLEALARRYGVTDPGEIDELIRLNQGARSKAWWDEFKDDVSEAYLTYVGFEAGANFVRQFQPLAVPGLLQTREYAETLAFGEVDAIRVGQRVKLRLKRQESLKDRENPPHELFVLDEAVIRRKVGIRTNPAIMPMQLRHIVDTAQANNLIKVRVLPFCVGAHVGMVRGAFTLLEFNGGLGELLHLESGTSETTLMGEDGRIADARDDFEAILAEALSPTDSLSFITQVADEMG
ncbi:transcriptional regulator [Acrocarpospora corrugata]|uniref:Transcriptional regulator n=1 Tax=Acrocarpospora corrugata TaxID=35763 RepID=A0A5M3VYQ8_9ACTN|nr:helix-turn-helix transcriptional regulator [Acrocarpospora corrugata]GES02007.1 transcriptional regulator [Acrocarpospora corrugata]